MFRFLYEPTGDSSKWNLLYKSLALLASIKASIKTLVGKELVSGIWWRSSGNPSLHKFSKQKFL